MKIKEKQRRNTYINYPKFIHIRAHTGRIKSEFVKKKKKKRRNYQYIIEQSTFLADEEIIVQSV